MTPDADYRPSARPSVQRWRTARWVLLALVVIVGVAALDHLPDRAAARRPDGSGVHVAGGRPRPGHAAA